MAITTEAVIIGGGVMAASILYNMASMGVVGAGAARTRHAGLRLEGRSSGAIRMHYSTEINARRPGKVLEFSGTGPDVVGGGGDPGFVRTGYMVFAPEHEVEGFRHNIEMQQRIGIDTRVVGWIEARELAPAFHLGESEQFAWEDPSGHGRPVRNGPCVALAPGSWARRSCWSRLPLRSVSWADGYLPLEPRRRPMRPVRR